MKHDPPAPLNNNDEAPSENEPPHMPLFRGNDDLERRSERRLSADPDTFCQILDPHTGHSWPAAVRNISLTGIALLMAKQFETGELLTIELRNARRALTRKYLVQVKHSDICCPNDTWLHGCLFARPLREEELRAWL